jgi:hypothetical protein
MYVTCSGSMHAPAVEAGVRAYVGIKSAANPTQMPHQVLQSSSSSLLLLSQHCCDSKTL